jgi:HisJ family histidinol phosphate phosphatase
MKPLYFDNHMHTPLCKHAEGQPEEYAEMALQRGLKGIVFTCHSPMPDNFWQEVRMAPEEFPEYVAMVDRATQTYAGKLDVRLGMETDYFPGFEWWAEKLNEQADFHHVLGSVHFFSPEYKAKFWKGDLMDFYRTYFRHVADSAETGLFDTLAHPDLVKNFYPDLYDFEKLQDTIEECLDRIAKTGVAMELNSSGIHKKYPELNPGPKMLSLMKARNIPVVIGSDSHSPRRVGADFHFAMDSLEEAGYQKISYFLNRKRYDVGISDVRNSLTFRLTEAAAG